MTDTPTKATGAEFPEIEDDAAGIFEDAPQAEAPKGGRNIEAMLNVGLDVQIVLGHARLPISQLLKFGRGSVIELDKKIGEPVEVMINDRLVARGDLVKLGEARIGVSLTEIVKDYVSGD
ncbi:FliM/FliN family flagellar motor switch protein [Limimaricola variabilis]|uniref:FliM/FliN family flagellar motor switch protein n=1 Tax=Limimaricola variabilis TaxID=1492771 RepID=UPI002AC9B049|nr:FliM/FliN family flagellar motor switch protein [Limimaricola variabilis]WPY94918.1 FliM/FliN family flagellar motor switch protein [Limimaricola variabilis]